MGRRLLHRFGTVRVRTTLGAVLAVGVVAVLGAVVILQQMRDSLEDEVEQTARLRASDMAAQLEAGVAPRSLPLEAGDDNAVQVVESHARIVAFSPELEGEPALAFPGPGEAVETAVPFDDDPFLVVSATADTDDTEFGRMTVIVGRSLDTVDEPLEVMTRLLTVAVPLLLVVVALTTWFVVGRALAPVEAMRREVDEISASELHRRVPTPAGRDEIAGLAETMNQMLDRLDRSQARQRRFVSDASHELRSPVASIRQHAEVALAHPDQTSLRDLAENVLAEDLRVQHLVDDLLLLARADEHSLPLQMSPVDLDDIVFEEATRLRPPRKAPTARIGDRAATAASPGTAVPAETAASPGTDVTPRTAATDATADQAVSGSPAVTDASAEIDVPAGMDGTDVTAGTDGSSGTEAPPAMDPTAPAVSAAGPEGLDESGGLRIDTTAVSAARVVGDVSSLRRVVRNLTDNAARHARSLVALSLVEEDGRAVLTVDDDGPGIPEDDRDRVFERFVRLDAARARDDRGGGAGLGLAIVAELVAAHAGTVSLSESPAGGARVRIEIPLAPRS